MNILKAKDRVSVSTDGGWEKEFTGTIDGRFIPTSTTSGTLNSYLVVFDEPQCDIDIGGPYYKGYILEAYLTKI